MLVEASANVNYKNKKGNTAIWIAASNGLLNIVTYLAEVGQADVDMKNARNVSPIFAAFIGGHLPVVKYFANIVGQFPGETEILKHLSAFQNSNSFKLQRGEEHLVKLLKDMRESIDVLYKAREVRSKHANHAIKALMSSFNGNCHFCTQFFIRV